ncbi:MAG: hypothetical protein PHE53_07405 [Thermoguttaceae bacterium]|nr:hypothetical protein [Thermoguttaceae bacterium]
MNCANLVPLVKHRILSVKLEVVSGVTGGLQVKNLGRTCKMRWARRPMVSFLLCGMLWMVGCGKPQLEPHNIHLTASLRTAISTRNIDWLTQNIEEIESRRACEQMGEREYAALMSIIAKAQSGDWEAAEHEILALQKAQRPTKEQMRAIHEQGAKCEYMHTHP